MILFHDYDFETNEILLKWREDVFRNIHISLLLGGTVSIILNAFLHWEEMSSSVKALEALVFCAILFINIFRNTPFNFRLYLTVVMLYVAAGTSLYNIGLDGMFWIWLLTSTVILSIFKKASIVFALLMFNFILINTVGLLIHFKILIVAPLTNFQVLQWMLNSFMFIWINVTFLVIILLARNIILDNFLNEKEIRIKREEEALILLKTKAKLKQSEAFYKEAVKIAHLGNWKFDLIKEQGYWSEEVYNIFGRDQALGAPSLGEFIAYLHPNDRDKYVKIFNEAIGGVDSGKYIFRIIRNDGSIKYVEGVVRKKIDGNDQVSTLFGTLMDVTGRKIKEIKLQESEDFYKDAERLAHLGSWKLDLHNNQVIWSDEIFRIFRRDPALGAPLLNQYLEYIHPDDRKSYYKSHLETLKNPDPLNFQFRILLKGNIVKYIEGTAQKRVNDNNEVLEMYGVLMDITDRKLKEIELKERESSYREAQKLAKLGHWEYDARSNRTYWSDELYRILNWDVKNPAPTPKEYLKYIHPDDIDGYKERLKMWMSSPEKDFFELRYITDNGETRYLEAITRKRLNSFGEVEYLYGTMLDITERVLVRNQLEENIEALNKKNQELDKFSYSTSHELRAPITSALGLTNLMRLEFSENSGVLEYIEMLEKSLKRLGDFIKEIADFSRNEKYAIQKTDIDIVSMIKLTVAELSFMVGASSIKYIIVPSAKLMIYTDKLRLQLILSNLISNAIKYHDLSKPHPQITITIDSSPKQFQIICEDNGIGIDRNYQDSVFDMFFTTGHKTYGTGLGLYILKESVNKLQGKVSLDSEKGIGTTFKVEIPIIK